MDSERSNSWWANILLYGFSLGVLLAALQFSHYRLMLLRNAEKWYIGAIAVLFAVVGIWAGKKLSRKPDLAQEAPSQPVQPKTEVLKQLGITPRELEVLEQMAKGLSNQEIASQLFVSLNTVKTHSSNVFFKLGAQRRTQAIQKAKALGIIA